jgi:hypothetical protein
LQSSRSEKKATDQGISRNILHTVVQRANALPPEAGQSARRHRCQRAGPVRDLILEDSSSAPIEFMTSLRP